MFRRQERRLRERREALDKRLEQLNKTVHAGVEADSEERAVQIANDEVRDHLRAEADAELAEIKRALARIQDGSYGTCTGCGGSIGEGRLGAYPAAALCMACADAADK